MRYPKGNKKLIRELNQSAVLNLIKSLGPISRTDIAKRSGLSAATITGISSKLLESKLIIEKTEGDSRGGRRPILLAINPTGGYVIGLKLSDDHITGVLTDIEATVIARASNKLINYAIENVTESLIQMVKVLLTDSKIEKSQLIGIGVGLAGIVDAKTGVLKNSPIFGWENVAISEILNDRLDIPVYIENDVNTLSINEQWFGKGQGVENFLTVTVGRGVGLGIVVNGQIYLGGNGGAGEFGHTVIDPIGPQCDCGNRGCLETFVADPALLRMAKEYYDEGKITEKISKVNQLLELAKSGNVAAIEIYNKAGETLGIGLANLINILNPELVIISGEGVRAGELLFGPMKKSISKHIMPGFNSDLKIQTNEWEDDAWARGAAGLVLKQLFESPYLKK